VNDPKTLTAKQARVIPYLLGAPSLEEGCKRAGVSKVTVYEWLKQEIFRQELKRQRDELIERALDSLKANVTKATETLVKLLDSESEPMQARAAEDIIAFAQKALEHEELEKRIGVLEERLVQQGGNHR
jgi:AcrR family transcriptional regulator